MPTDESTTGPNPPAPQLVDPTHPASPPSAVILNPPVANQNQRNAEPPLDYVGGTPLTRRLFGNTPGERRFNIGDWIGIGFGANTAVSLVGADQTGFSRGRKIFNKATDWLSDSWPYRRAYRGDVPKLTADERQQLSNFGKVLEEHPEVQELKKTTGRYDQFLDKILDGKEPSGEFLQTLKDRGALKVAEGVAEKDAFEAAKKTLVAYQKARIPARLMTGFFMLGTGGWVLMAPIKWGEDRKAQIVEHLDKNYAESHHLNDQEKAAIARSHEEMRREPKQTWSSVLTSRLIGHVGIIGIYLATGPARGENWIASKLGIKAFKGADHWSEQAATAMIEKAAGSTKNAAGELVRPENGNWVSRLENWLGRSPAKQDAAAAMEAAEKAQGAAAASKAAPEPAADAVAKAGKARLKGNVSNFLVEILYSSTLVMATFGMSRVLAPLFDKDCKKRNAEPAAVPSAPVVTPPSAPAPLPANDAAPAIASLKDGDASPAPVNRVNAPVHHGLAAQEHHQAVQQDNRKPAANAHQEHAANHAHFATHHERALHQPSPGTGPAVA